MPDGQIIRIDDHCRFNTPEALFHPEKLGPEFDVTQDKATKYFAGVHQMVFDSIMMCDAHLRKDLFRNIVLAGGTSMFKGLAKRMEAEVEALTDGQEEVKIVQDSQRKHAAWVGGSIFASLGTFHSIKYTIGEYRVANDVVHMKYF